jgi:chromosome segregation ATPase
MAAQGDRLQAIKDELTDLLEVRIGDLMGAVRATQEVTRRIVYAEEEIRRQTQQREQLERELGPLQSHADGLEGETRDLQARVERARANVDRLRSLREELMNNLSNLKGELDE